MDGCVHPSLSYDHNPINQCKYRTLWDESEQAQEELLPTVLKLASYQKDAESSWGEPESVADCIWDAHTDMQLFVQLDNYGYTGMG